MIAWVVGRLGFVLDFSGCRMGTICEKLVPDMNAGDSTI